MSEQNAFIGFIHTRDVAVCIAEERPLIVDKLVKPLQAVPSQLEVERLLPMLRQRGQRMAMVLDETLRGVVNYRRWRSGRWRSTSVLAPARVSTSPPSNVGDAAA